MYRPGPVYFGLGAAVRAQDSLWQAARPYLQEIVARHDETTYLTALQGHSVIFQEKIESSQPVRYVVDLGDPFRLTTGVAGLAILSALPSAEVEEILAEPIPRYTDNTVTSPDQLRRELAKFRREGYAMSIGRWTRDGGGVAAPFFRADGSCGGAIAISGPASRITPRIAALAASVVWASSMLSRRLGYVPAKPESADDAGPR